MGNKGRAHELQHELDTITIKHGQMEFGEFERRERESTDSKTQRRINRGRVEHKGHRAKFCILPENEEGATELLKFMFSDPDGWKMRIPVSVLSCPQSGGHPVRKWYPGYIDN